MAKLIYEDGRFVFQCVYAERDIARNLKFKWHKDDCVWYTYNIKSANKLREYADSDTKETIERRLTSFEKSYAVESDFEVPVPEGLILRPYQKAAVEWCSERKVSLVADEMGSGKTISALAVANHLSSLSKTDLFVCILVVCPASMKYVWEDEAKKWLSYDAGIHIVNKGKEKIPFWEDMIIINYDLLINRNIRDQLLKMDFDLAIIDEAHYLKNNKAARTKSLLNKWIEQKGKRLASGIIHRAKKIVLLTGTPITNKPRELHPILKTLSLETIMPYKTLLSFGRRFCGAYNGPYGWVLDGASHMEDLNQRLRSTLMIRRLKKDILKDLPDKEVMIIPFDHNVNTKKVERALEKTVDVEELKKQKLRKPNGEPIELGELVTLRKELAEAKLPIAIKYIQEQLDSHDYKVVLFAHHKEVIQKLMDAFSEYNPVSITGATTPKKRKENVDIFQKDEKCRIFIGNIQAAGVGLTLTASPRVTFIEPSWVPGEMDQAIDRVHRSGQTEKVLAEILVIRNTIEEHMMNRMYKKKLNIKRIVN